MIDHFSGETRWLSNFELVDVEFEGIIYPSSEHAFQAAKSLDVRERRQIAALRTPREAKTAGRMIKLRPDWESVKIDVMRTILREKFSERHPELRERLRMTGDQKLVEGNTWHDTFWGVCDGRGQNWLGRILMEIRSGL